MQPYCGSSICSLPSVEDRCTLSVEFAFLKSKRNHVVISEPRYHDSNWATRHCSDVLGTNMVGRNSAAFIVSNNEIGSGYSQLYLPLLGSYFWHWVSWREIKTCQYSAIFQHWLAIPYPWVIVPWLLISAGWQWKWSLCAMIWEPFWAAIPLARFFGFVTWHGKLTRFEKLSTTLTNNQAHLHSFIDDRTFPCGVRFHWSNLAWCLPHLHRDGNGLFWSGHSEHI